MSSKRNNVHVVPREDGWAIVRQGAERATAIVPTQEAAILKARAIAREEKGEMFIHGTDNRIRERNSYGPDPFPPKG